MGRVTTPAYRVEYQTVGRYVMTPASWHVSGPIGYGRPTGEALARHVAALVASMAPGGCNDGLGVIVVGARIVRQSTGDVVASWAR